MEGIMQQTSKEKTKKKGLLTILVLLVLVVFCIIVIVINSTPPERLSLENVDTNVEGAVFTKTNQALVEQLYHNWFPNDLFWPTAFLDNMPNFQIGVLEVVRYNVRVMRDNLTRMRTTDKLDVDVEKAFTALSNDPYKWWFPSAEDKWRLAYKKLSEFYENLLKGEAYFYPRADNLVELLNQYVSLMGGVNTRLINAPGDRRQVLMLDNEPKGAGKVSKMVDVDIPWHDIDDNFYYAQGVAYALYESLKAVRTDFEGVLRDKNSLQLADKILEDLNRCYFEPIIVFNGDLDSVFANHSLNLSGIFNDARQKMVSLTVSLQQG